MSILKEKLVMVGFENKLILNEYIQIDQANDKIVLFFPGLHYNLENPLFYYLKQYYLDKNYDILQIDYHFKERISEFQFDPDLLEQIVRFESKVIFDKVIKLNKYSEIVIAGKSLGCAFMSGIFRIEHRFNRRRFLWLTPLLTHKEVSHLMLSCKDLSFLAIGDEDPFYDQNVYEALKSKENFKCLLINKADHRLETKKKYFKSIEDLKNVIKNIDIFMSE